MSDSGKVQVFPYSFKTIGFGGEEAAITAIDSLGRHVMGLEIINPEDLYQVEELFFYMRWQNTTPSPPNPASVLTKIRVQDDFSSPIYSSPDININESPDGDGYIECERDLTAFRNPTGRNIIILEFDQAASGHFAMFKADMLYTVMGVR